MGGGASRDTSRLGYACRRTVAGLAAVGRWSSLCAVIAGVGGVVAIGVGSCCIRWRRDVCGRRGRGRCRGFLAARSSWDSRRLQSRAVSLHASRSIVVRAGSVSRGLGEEGGGVGSVVRGWGCDKDGDGGVALSGCRGRWLISHCGSVVTAGVGCVVRSCCSMWRRRGCGRSGRGRCRGFLAARSSWDDRRLQSRAVSLHASRSIVVRAGSVSRGGEEEGCGIVSARVDWGCGRGAGRGGFMTGAGGGIEGGVAVVERDG
jgi:hypothetical protein